MISTSITPTVGASQVHPFKGRKEAYQFVLSTPNRDLTLYHVTDLEGFDTKWSKQQIQKAGSIRAHLKGSNAIDIRNKIRIKVRLTSNSPDKLREYYETLEQLAYEATHFGRFGWYYHIGIDLVSPLLKVGGGINSNAMPVVLEGYRIFPYAVQGKVTTEAAYNAAAKVRTLIGLAVPEAQLSPTAKTLYLNRNGESDASEFDVKALYYNVPTNAWADSDNFPSGGLVRTVTQDNYVKYVVNMATPNLTPYGTYSVQVTGNHNGTNRNSLFTIYINEGNTTLDVAVSNLTANNPLESSENYFTVDEDTNAFGQHGFIVSINDFNDNQHGFDVNTFELEASPIGATSGLVGNTLRVYVPSNTLAGVYDFKASVVVGGIKLTTEWQLAIIGTPFLVSNVATVGTEDNPYSWIPSFGNTTISSITHTGVVALPAGLSWVNNQLVGTPQEGSAGTYNLEMLAVGTNETLNETLTYTLVINPDLDTGGTSTKWNTAKWDNAKWS